MKTDMNPNAKLSFLERFAYGLGDYAGNLVYSAISASDLKGMLMNLKNFLNISMFPFYKRDWGGKTANLSTPVIRCKECEVFFTVFAVN